MELDWCSASILFFIVLVSLPLCLVLLIDSHVQDRKKRIVNRANELEGK